MRQAPRWGRTLAAALTDEITPMFGGLPVQVALEDDAPFWHEPRWLLCVRWPRWRPLGPERYYRAGEWRYCWPVRRVAARHVRPFAANLAWVLWRWLLADPRRRRGWDWRLPADTAPAGNGVSSRGAGAPL